MFIKENDPNTFSTFRINPIDLRRAQALRLLVPLMCSSTDQSQIQYNLSCKLDKLTK